MFAGVGDTLITIDKYRNLENALGKADVFGRKTKEGRIEVRFAGMEKDGSVVLYRRDISILTNETTMSRSGLYTSTTNSTDRFNADVTTQGNVVTVKGDIKSSSNTMTSMPKEDYHVVVPEGSIPIKLSPDERVLPISGLLIIMENRSKNSIQYRIQNQQ